MGDKNMLLWLLLLAVLVVSAYWHARENRQMKRQWDKNHDPDTAQALNRFAWSRSVQLMAALACLALVVIVYDWQLSGARNTIAELSQAEAGQQKALAEAEARLAAATAAAAAQPPAVAASPPEPAPPPESEAESVADVYNPTGGDNQTAMDNIKKRYEDILVTYMFLKKCGKVNPADYHVIISALSKEMASVNAPGRMQYDVLTSAQGSYKEIYSQSSCKGEGVAALLAQYNNYIKVLSNDVPQ